MQAGPSTAFPTAAALAGGGSGVSHGDGHTTEGGDRGCSAELARSLSHLPGCALAFSAVAAVAGK